MIDAGLSAGSLRVKEVRVSITLKALMTDVGIIRGTVVLLSVFLALVKFVKEESSLANCAPGTHRLIL